MKRLSQQQGGFTIVELMIATLVFSVILTLATYGILNIGKLYRKSLTSNQTQQTARSIIDTVSQNIKFNGGSFAAGTNVYCLGSNKKLSFRLNTQFVSASTHGLVIEDTPCTSTPTSFDFGGAFPSGAKELLGPRMRLASFFICSSITSPDANNCTTTIVNNLKPTTYYVLVRVIYGDNDLITGGNCKLDVGREFCSVSELSSYVQKVVQ